MKIIAAGDLGPDELTLPVGPGVIITGTEEEIDPLGALLGEDVDVEPVPKRPADWIDERLKEFAAELDDKIRRETVEAVARWIGAKMPDDGDGEAVQREILAAYGNGEIEIGGGE